LEVGVSCDEAFTFIANDGGDRRSLVSGHAAPAIAELPVRVCGLVRGYLLHTIKFDSTQREKPPHLAHLGHLRTRDGVRLLNVSSHSHGPPGL
jgi:hypothetical protein